MSRRCYVTTYLNNSPYRVFEGLILHEPFRKARCTIAFIDNDAIHIEEVEHFEGRNSARYFVYPDEFETMYEDIRKDWEARGVWRLQWEDVNNFRSRP